jgi:hypothetical protein
MLDTLTSRNHQDFRQRYGGTFGWFHYEGKKIFVYVDNANDSQVTFTDSKKTPYVVYRDSGYQFEFLPVTRGWYNTLKGAYYLSRIPARQWHRGIYAGNTRVYQFTDTLRNQTCSMEILSEVFENQITVEKALEQYYLKERPAVALTKHFALGGDRFYFDDQVVGSVDISNGDITIKLSEPVIRQEILDAIRRNNFGIKVE